MINRLDQITVENEKFYEESKNKLNKKLGIANEEYQTLLNDFNSQIDYVNRNNEYTKEGKANKNNEILNRFIDKVNYAALNHYADLNSEVSIILKEYEIKKLENVTGLNAEIMPQLIYVTSMINNIKSINDSDLLESVFDYICVENNFSDELVNLVYLKARNILNNESPKVGQDNDNKIDVVEASNRGRNRTKISNIINKIEKYKTDYLKEFESIASTFKLGAETKKYPASLYLNKDIKSEFTLISNKINNPWKK